MLNAFFASSCSSHSCFASATLILGDCSAPSLFLFSAAYLGLGSSLLAQAFSVLPTSSGCPSPYPLKPTPLQKKARELFHLARWSPSLQKCSRPGWMGPRATCSNEWHCYPWQGVGTNWHFKILFNPKHSMILENGSIFWAVLFWLQSPPPPPFPWPPTNSSTTGKFSPNKTWAIISNGNCDFKDTDKQL